VNDALTTEMVAGELAEYEERYGPPAGTEQHVGMLRAALAGDRPVTSRKELPLHVTCSAVPVREDGRVLLVHHRLLGIWLFPGGHLEPDDGSLAAAARRELVEEAGIEPAAHAANSDAVLLHVGIHPIPANPARDEPAHVHADFRYLVPVDDQAVTLQAEEVTDWRWVRPDRIEVPALVRRLPRRPPC
jgi:8-oxo-dGTP pyrophosphatase MutT (NUDIX family)